MRVHTHLRRPLDPLATLDEDYSRALIHLAWDQTTSGARTLLFAFVELLPLEIPPPPDDGEKSLGLDTGHSLRLRRIERSAREALDWYLDCRRGVFAVPDEQGDLTPIIEPGVDVVLGEEPAWPSLVCTPSHETIPFCPLGISHPRVHHLVARAAFPLDHLWPERGVATRVTQWLDDHLHFSLADYPEYWGSVHLIAPNPVFRSVGARLRPTTAGDAVLIRFQPRAGKELHGLELSFSEREFTGALDLRHLAVEGPLFQLELGRTAASVEDEVFDPRRGVLSARLEGGRFIRSVSVSEVRNSRHPPAPVREQPDSYVASAAERMRGAHFERKRRAEATQRLELFEGRSAALDTLREQLRRSQRDVLVVDPELRSIEDLLRGQLWYRGQTLRFLTSSAHDAPTRKDQLRAELGAHSAEHESLHLELRVTSDKAAAPGSFFVVDGRAWMMNAPLHRIGERGTLIVAVPREQALERLFATMWDDAEPWFDSESGV